MKIKIDENLIQSVLAGTANEDEAKQVAELFATESGQQYLSDLLDTDFNDAPPQVPHEIPKEKIFKLIQKRIKQLQLRKFLFRAAAVLFPLIILTGLVFQVNSRVDLFGTAEFITLTVPRGERIQLVFQDGSKVYLNAGANLRYPKQFGLLNRTVYLEGEGYFEVTPNPRRPFIVELDRASIHVIGTAFNVASYLDEPEGKISLDNGLLAMTTCTQKNQILNPGQNLVYNKQSGVCVITSNSTETASLWKNDILYFKSKSLGDVIKTLERWYDVKFVIQDTVVYQYAYTIMLDNENLENTLIDLEKIAPIKFEYNKAEREVRVTVKQ